MQNRIRTAQPSTTGATPATEPLPSAGQDALKRLEQALTPAGLTLIKGGAR